MKAPSQSDRARPPHSAPAGRDDSAPRLRVRVPERIREDVLGSRGLAVDVTAAADGRVVVELRDRRGRLRARAATPVDGGRLVRVRLRVPDVRLGRLVRGRLVVRVTAVDRAGNRRIMRRSVAVWRAA